MKLSIPDHIRAIAPYKPGKPLEELEREYGLKGSVKLASNENPLGPSPRAVTAIADALGNLHRYPDGGGYELKIGISEYLGIDPGCIVLGAGSDDIIAMLIRAFLWPGCNAVVPHPSFLMYPIGVAVSGAELIRVPLAEMSLDLRAMGNAVTSETKLVFVCNPNNPTGTVVGRAAFEKFLETLPTGVVVVIDEAYYEFVRDPDHFSGIEYLDSDHPVVVLRTFSKAYGLAGLRIGYGVMPAVVADILHRVRQPFNASAIGQIGAAAALEDAAFLKKSVALIHEGLDRMFEGLDRLGIRFFPTQANFFLIDVETDANRIFQKMLEKGVIVRSMTSYGYPTYIRVNVGLADENERFLSALNSVLETESSPLNKEEVSCETVCEDTLGNSENRIGDLVVTIDGPAGAGKTTVSRLLARQLNYRYVDTGALYRAVALAVMQQGISPDDDMGLGAVCASLELAFVSDEGILRLLSNGEDITDRIRTPEISMMASAVSARQVVRDYLLELQRSMEREKRVVFEGRDMGTVVFPDADVKFFLDASGETRALRRFKEDAVKEGASLEKVAEEIRMRDENDSNRELAPLKPAPDAVHIDSTQLSVQEVVNRMLDHVRLATE